MKKIFSTVLGLSAFLFAICLNLGYAVNDYGLLSNTLSVKVQAQMVAINHIPTSSRYSDYDYFTFNGQSWSTGDFGYWGNNWKPVIQKCTYTSGGWNFGLVYVAYGVYSTGRSTYNGHGVACNAGPGNCFDGTSCIPNNS